MIWVCLKWWIPQNGNDNRNMMIYDDPKLMRFKICSYHNITDFFVGSGDFESYHLVI